MNGDLKLQHLDFNLLRVFLAVFEEQSVARAAARLNVSPSAISHSLGSLRHFFDDELFVRAGSAMRPTRLALDMGPRVRAAMAQLERAIAPSDFDPARHRRRFTMMLTPYWCRLMLPALMDRFNAEAPHSEIRVRAATDDPAVEFMRGDADLGVALKNVDSPELTSELLFSDEWAWAIPSADAPPDDRLTLEALVALPHVIVTPRLERMGASSGDTGDWTSFEMDDHGALRQALVEAGLRRRVSVNVPDLATGLAVAGRSRHAMLTPRRLAQSLAPTNGLRLLKPPYPTRPIDSRMVWRNDAAPDTGVEWLKNLVRDAARSIGDAATG